MHLTITLIFTAILANASLAARGTHGVAQHHARVSPRAPSLESPAIKAKKRRNCSSPKSDAVSFSCASPTPKASSKAKPKPTSTSKTKTKAKTTSTVKPKPTPQVLAASTGDVLSFEVSRCGPNGATKSITKTTGPNGSLDWLNCGITTSNGWNPPPLKVSDIVYVPLSTAVKQSGTPFAACSKYVPLFDQYGEQFGIPGILLAAFAMQESSCNPATVGGGGEQGLMQITKEKCAGAPGGNCKEPNFNIKTGAAFFAKTLESNGGDLLLSIGQYNGWYQGLTVAKATAAAHSSCCRCQNNLDYLHQFLNGWLQNEDAYTLNLGHYFNLNVCPQ
ncbi:glycoside hydrolase family 23 protein [Roridomyces roridus]|uniref:Glycoside hydrolase family 23 protein n=1 Tax=Roridomyces roridus TaxID=1738132 RepID=A0AAD7G0A2_9AGAR|nr:glycoside hydrolase family 23 protein [Roridomyces roridus]